MGTFFCCEFYIVFNLPRTRPTFIQTNKTAPDFIVNLQVLTDIGHIPLIINLILQML